MQRVKANEVKKIEPITAFDEEYWQTGFFIFSNSRISLVAWVNIMTAKTIANSAFKHVYNATRKL